MSRKKDARGVVLSCVKAINDEDFGLARQYVSDDLSFVGVLGFRHGADAYFSDMERMHLKYDVKKVIAQGQDVCVFCNLTMSGTTIFESGWYRVEDGKICSLKVVFDPRPILDRKTDRKTDRKAA